MTGMRNPMNSWGRSDSAVGDARGGFLLGDNDAVLALRLCAAGSEHRKFLRQLPVIMEITAPLYWWKQMDQYKVGTVTDSCSTMHRLTHKEFELRDFSVDCVKRAGDEKATLGGETVPDEKWAPRAVLAGVVEALNNLRAMYIQTGEKTYWKAINQLLPQSYEQKRTWSGNYEALRSICRQRRGHKLEEWKIFIDWVRDSVPYAEELIFGGDDEE